MQTDTDFGLFYRKRVHGETRGGELPPALSAGGTWCVVHGGELERGCRVRGEGSKAGSGAGGAVTLGASLPGRLAEVQEA